MRWCGKRKSMLSPSVVVCRSSIDEDATEVNGNRWKQTKITLGWCCGATASRVSRVRVARLQLRRRCMPETAAVDADESVGSAQQLLPDREHVVADGQV